MAYSYSDQLHWSDASTLVIEIQKSHRLYLTLENLVDELIEHVSKLKLAFASSIAPNPVAAAMLAKHDLHCWSQESLEQHLDNWPMDQLMLDPNTHRSIGACGLKTLGKLRKQPRDQRIRRFGIKLNHYIEELYGHYPTPLKWSIPTEDYYQRIDLNHPVIRTETLKHHLFRALTDLGQWLDTRDKALTQLSIRLKHEIRSSSSIPDLVIDIGLAEPGFNRHHLENLIELKLESIHIASPLNTIIIQCKSHHERRPEHMDLFSGHRQGQSWPELLDRLKTKLGQEGLASLAMCPHHQPERSWCWTTPNQTYEAIDSRIRPTWLVADPMPCERHQLVLEKGPERIETDWWAEGCQRDYWIAREPNGRRLWVFREHHPRTGWFIHGIFD